MNHDLLMFVQRETFVLLKLSSNTGTYDFLNALLFGNTDLETWCHGIGGGSSREFPVEIGPPQIGELALPFKAL